MYLLSLSRLANEKYQMYIHINTHLYHIYVSELP